MNTAQTYQYFEGNSFSHIYGQDVRDGKYAFMLSYPSTAAWSAFPNTKKYYIQDGSVEEKKVGYDKIKKKEPWRVMSVLGELLPGLLTSSPPDLLVTYWREHFGFDYENMVELSPATYCDDLNDSSEYEKIITLFPYDHLLPEKHAVDPEKHYYMLSKCALTEASSQSPHYTSVNLHETSVEKVEYPSEYPYVVKTTHGLSGEGTYLIKHRDDLYYCFQEVGSYIRIKLLDAIVVMDFVHNTAMNYCVQFYVNKAGETTLLGATNQLVTERGEYLGGLIHYKETDMTKFFPIITHVSEFVHHYGYFGVVGVDVLEDGDGELHMIDANIRVNGSTPLCLQRNTLLALGKEVAKFSTDYRMEGTLDAVMTTLKPELDQKDFIILSALEYHAKNTFWTDIYGIVTGETVDEMLMVEEKLKKKGLEMIV